MTDTLDKIDASFEEVEEQLLDALARIRDEPPKSTPYIEIDAGIKSALAELVEHLHGELANSGDRSNLQLLTERHEILFARIGVLRQLLGANIPYDTLVLAHEGVKDRQRKLEVRVVNQRKQNGGGVPDDHPVFDHVPSPQRVARNRLKVTRKEETALEIYQVYSDIGIYSASRELAVIASLLRGGTLDRPPAADVEDAKARAVFESRDLSFKAPPVRTKPPAPEPAKPPAVEKRDIAQTPEEIRRKLLARQGQGSAGKATFAAKDIDPVSPPEFRRRPEPPPKAEPLPPTTGKAIFSAKDIEPAAPQEFRRRPEPPKQEPPPPPTTGKAIFGAKDIEPEFPQEPPRKRDKPPALEEEKKERTGPATFESRDLSKSPYKDN